MTFRILPTPNSCALASCRTCTRGRRRRPSQELGAPAVQTKGTPQTGRRQAEKRRRAYLEDPTRKWAPIETMYACMSPRIDTLTQDPVRSTGLGRAVGGGSEGERPSSGVAATVFTTRARFQLLPPPLSLLALRGARAGSSEEMSRRSGTRAAPATANPSGFSLRSGWTSGSQRRA